MPSAILDAFGKPAQYLGSGGALYQRNQDDARLRPPPGAHFDDYMSLLSSGRWKQLVSESRAIGSRGLVAAALVQKADYVSGSHWRPYFTGEDADYGEEAEELLEDTAGLCCTRGPRYDWRTIWRLGVLTNGPDGGFFILLTDNGEGWPLLQPLEAHRIGQRGSGAMLVTAKDAFSTITDDDGMEERITTPYVDLRIVNGIIYNKAGAEVAYRVLGPTPAEDEDVSARNMIHVAAPRWFSEGRPIPQIAPALLDLLGVDLARTCQLDQQVIDSKLTLIEENDTGRRDPIKDLVNPPFTQPTLNNTAPDVIERGGIRYVKKGGGSIKAHDSSRPSDQWMNYDLRMAATAIAAIGWRLEMLDPSALRGAATRAFQDQINTTIMNCFADVRHAAKRCTQYRVAKFTNLGMLRDHEEFLKWDITPPPEFVVDRNSASIDLELVRGGADAMPYVHRRAGHRPRQVLTTQAKYEKMKDEIAKQYGIDPTRLGTMSIPGDALGTEGQKPAAKKPATEETGKKQARHEAAIKEANDNAERRFGQILDVVRSMPAPQVKIEKGAIAVDARTTIDKGAFTTEGANITMTPSPVNVAPPNVSITLPEQKSRSVTLARDPVTGVLTGKVT